MRLFLLLAAALVTSTAGHAQELPRASIIMVSGEAKRMVAPDEARLNVNVRAEYVKLSQAKEEHDKKLKTLLAIAKDFGIAENDMKTQDARVERRYDSDRPTAVPTPPSGSLDRRNLAGYAVNSYIAIKIRKLDAVGALLEKLTEHQFDQTNIQYSIADPKTLRDAMLAEAIKDAKEKAEKMAVAAGSGLGKVYAIAQTGVSFPRFFSSGSGFGMAGGYGGPPAMASAAPAALPIGEQEISANVTVAFELKD